MTETPGKALALHAGIGKGRGRRSWALSAQAAVVSLFLAYGLAGGLLGGYVVWVDRQAVIADSERGTADLARLLEDHILNALRATEVLLARVDDLVAREGGVHAVGALPGWAEMTRKLGTSPHIASLYLLDADGAVVATSGEEAPPGARARQDQKDFFAVLKAGGEGAIGQVARDPWTHTFAFPVARRLTTPTGEFAGAAVANIQVSFFKALYHGLNLGAAPGLGVYRLDGAILVREPLPESDIGRDMSNSPVYTTYLPQAPIGTYRGKSAYDGVMRVVSYRKLEERGLLVWVATSLDDAMAEWRRRLVQVSSLMIVGLALSGWLAYRTSRAITRERDVEARLFLEKEQAEITLLSIADGILTTDAGGRLVYANPAARRLLNRAPEDLKGRLADEVLRLFDERRGVPLEGPVGACLREERHADIGDDALLRREDGVEIPIEAHATPMHDSHGALEGAVVALRDVAQERHLRRMLSHQARHDPLTGLMNRRAFEERLRLALNQTESGQAGTAWLCYLDLDQFKLINDTCGHLAGDELLKQVARELTAAIGAEEMIARMGGDEFATVLRGVSRDLAYEQAERMRRRLSELRFAWQTQSFTTSGSFGLVPILADSGSLYDLLSAADRACYVAKNHGRNRIHVADALDEATSAFGGEMRWAHATIRALDDDRFVLYGQPIRSLTRPADGPHLEVLLRMRDDDGAIIAPGSFIPAAERYNLMRQVDRWVISHLLDDHLAGERASGLGPGALVAINVSAQSLCDEEFLGFALSAIDRSTIDPRALCFEVTETAAISNLTRAQEVMRALKGRGCRFALDDFGSGLSSFGYLKNLPVDFLKIDGAFVRNIVTHDLDRAFVRSINDIGHLMGIRTIGEYVESPEIEHALKDIGVDFAQGYAVGMPVPLDTLLEGV